MSDRYATIPGSAVEQSLSYIARSLDRIDRRTRWTGAVRATHPSPVSLARPGPVTIASLTLDPGRWLIIGGSYLILNVSNAVSKTTMTLTNVQHQPAVEQEFRDLLFDPGMEMSVIGTGILTAQTTVSMQVAWILDTPTGFDNGSSSDTYLLAVPA